MHIEKKLFKFKVDSGETTKDQKDLWAPPPNFLKLILKFAYILYWIV